MIDNRTNGNGNRPPVVLTAEDEHKLSFSVLGLNLTAERRRLIIAWLDNPTDTWDDIANRAGCDPKTVQRARKDPKFLQALEQFQREYQRDGLVRSTQYMRARIPHVIQALVETACDTRAGRQIEAAKMVLELNPGITEQLRTGIIKDNGGIIDCNLNADHINVNGRSGAIGANGTMIIPVAKLPLAMKIELLRIVEAEQAERDAEQREIQAARQRGAEII